MQITPTDLNLARLIQGHAFYSVPIYQREYSWQKEHHQELWSDIEGLMDPKENLEDHFMGVIVVTTHDDGDIFRVLDGQQRVSTFLLMFAALRDAAKSSPYVGDERASEFEDDADRSILYDKKPGEREWRPRMKLNRQDDRYFQQVIESGDTSDPDFQSHKNIRRSYKFYHNKFTEEFEGSGDDFLDAFLNTVLEGLFLVRLKVNSEANAHVLFETLNDRGLALSDADLIKNYALGMADDEGADMRSLLRLWEGAVQEVGDDNINTYLKHWWASSHGLTRNLYKSVKAELKPYSVEQFLEKISEESVVYSNISDPSQSFWGAEAHRLMENLDKLKVSQVKALLLSGYQGLSDKDFRELTGFVERFIFRFSTVFGGNPSKVEKRYSKLAVKLRKGEVGVPEVKKNIRELSPSRQAFLEAYSEAKFRTQYQARYVLTKINNTLAESYGDQERAVDRSKINLEHVLPRRPNQDWHEYLETIDEEHSELVNLIGNMTILGDSYNKSASNKSYEDKIPQYESSDLIINDPGKLRNLGNRLRKEGIDIGLGEALAPSWFAEGDEQDGPPEFGPEEIRKRQEILGELSHLIWNTDEDSVDLTEV
jgi:hypothetical protein